MKKILCLMIVILLVGCGQGQPADKAGDVESRIPESQPELAESESGLSSSGQGARGITGPPDRVPVFELHYSVMVGSGHTTLANGETVDVQLVLQDAVYNPNPPESYWDSHWSGDLCVVVTDSQGEAVTTQIGVKTGGSIKANNWSFGSKFGDTVPFVLCFDDYNSDGNPDFTIGYMRWIYDLFTILPDKSVHALEHDEIWFDVWHRHSAKLYKTGPYTFSTYNAHRGMDTFTEEELEQLNNLLKEHGIVPYIEYCYEWNGESFVLVKKRGALSYPGEAHT